ncbi:glycosyltransferase family 2 protein [Acidianus manzaensis]|uniref:Glycosyltransferase 2-like domain-containing protein n=1 Tax=Acidianus manzaensis TaxID=282676 RepID=A0A1W6K339_9CREN|nr:glycosyltransferase family 2 protein [Acidianus manzaensis]ARM76936.1 hypothetical protein B6F84_13525 [Acidianus manzaensis]
MVFISVIITAHDRKDYLMQAVDSVLNQTLPKTEYEVIVVKNFDEYTKELEKKGVKVIVTSDKELGKKIVIGTKEAKGEIITLLEDDDLFLPKKLEKVKKAFENKDVIFHSHGIQVFKYNNIPSDIRESKDEEMIIDVKKINRTGLKRLLLDHNYSIYFNTSRMSIRREVFKENEKLIEKFTFELDFLLFYVSALYGKLIVYDPEILSLYRVHNKSTNGFNVEFNEWLNKQVLIRKTHIEKFPVIKNFIEKKV